VTAVIHAGGEGECSRYESAKAILQEAGLQCRVVPISTAESGRLAVRPSYSVLSTALLRQHRLSLLPWRTGLQRFVADTTALHSSAIRDRRTVKMRILQACNQLGIGGTEKTLHTFSKYLDKSRSEDFACG